MTEMAMRGFLPLFYHWVKEKINGNAPVEKHFRKPGRPKVIPEEYEPMVTAMCEEGYGYRAIARILREECGLNPGFI